MFTRRDFVVRNSAIVAGAFAAQRFGAVDLLSGVALAQENTWDAGKLFHLLPMVSHNRALLKCSFQEALGQTPEIMIDGRRVTGQRTDSRGQFWDFDIAALKPGTEYKLELRSGGRALAEPWALSTFPDLDSEAQHVRVVFYTCAGGHDIFKRFQSIAVRQALLRKALSFSPHAMVANGDQVYWDLFAPGSSKRMGASKLAIDYAGRVDGSKSLERRTRISC
ncbi:MAG: hypothetical protein ACRECO_14040 [Xanthobacteraceae bacterium]